MESLFDVRPGRGRVAWWIAVSLPVMIAVLAGLQYRWIDRLSRAEREQMRGDLNAAVGRFRQEFDGELTRALLSLHMGPPGPPSRDWAGTAGQVAGWRATSPWRSAVLDFYQASGGAGEERLLRFDPVTQTFQPVEWPARIARLRGVLERMGEGGNRMPRPPFAAVVHDDVAALVAARMGPPPGFGPMGYRGRTDAGGSMRWSIVELDLPVIQLQMLPQLVRKHFGSAYRVRVVGNTFPHRVIFDSAPGAPMSKADASAGLFEIRSDRTGPGIEMRMRMSPPNRPEPPPPEEGLRPLRHPPAGQSPAGDSPWVLEVGHTAGSIDAAVGERRRRDFIASLGILLLLTAGAVLLVLSTRRLERVARMQMEFVAGVSHELRTPLSVICLAADNLSQGVVTGEEQVKRYGSVIEREGRRLSEMVEQVLGYAGIQSGRAQFRFQPVDVAALIDRALAAAGPELRRAGCEVERKVPPGIPPVTADETALAHCVGNLLANALKYGGGSWIGIGAAPGASGDDVEIWVRDRGPGIDPADLPHIFEPFYRGRGVAGGQVRGTGLGLNLVERVMAAHGGNVEVQTSPGAGSRFTLHLPAAKAAKA